MDLCIIPEKANWVDVVYKDCMRTSQTVLYDWFAVCLAYEVTLLLESFAQSSFLFFPPENLGLV